jgi:hypothetical protein
VKYKVLRSRNKPVVVYAIPISADPNTYKILYPDCLEKDVLGVLETCGIKIQGFEGCSELAVSEIREHLRQTLDESALTYRRNANTAIVGGVAVALLGILNWMLPDPLPLADEVLLIITGTVLALFGLRRRRHLARYKDRLAQARGQIRELGAKSQSVLTRLFRSIRAREKPEIEDDNLAASSDRIDLESRWLVRYIDVQEMIESGDANELQIREIAASLCDVVPLKALIKLEKHRDRSSARRRMKRLRERITDRTGIPDGVLSVYCEFYKSARNYFESRGGQL